MKTGFHSSPRKKKEGGEHILIGIPKYHVPLAGSLFLAKIRMYGEKSSITHLAYSHMPIYTQVSSIKPA
jgi:hypothetical protein